MPQIRRGETSEESGDETEEEVDEGWNLEEKKREDPGEQMLVESVVRLWAQRDEPKKRLRASAPSRMRRWMAWLMELMLQDGEDEVEGAPPRIRTRSEDAPDVADLAGGKVEEVNMEEGNDGVIADMTGSVEEGRVHKVDGMEKDALGEEDKIMADATGQEDGADGGSMEPTQPAEAAPEMQAQGKSHVEQGGAHKADGMEKDALGKEDGIMADAAGKKGAAHGESVEPIQPAEAAAEMQTQGRKAHGKSGKAGEDKDVEVGAYTADTTRGTI